MSLSVMWHNQQMIHYFGVFSEAVCSNSPFVLKSLVIMRAKKVRRRERPAQETQQNTRLMNISACCGWYIFCSFRFIFFFCMRRMQTPTFHPLSPRQRQQDVYCVSAAAAPVSLCGQTIIQLQNRRNKVPAPLCLQDTASYSSLKMIFTHFWEIEKRAAVRLENEIQLKNAQKFSFAICVRCFVLSQRCCVCVTLACVCVCVCV